MVLSIKIITIYKVLSRGGALSPTLVVYYVLGHHIVTICWYNQKSHCDKKMYSLQKDTENDLTEAKKLINKLKKDCGCMFHRS